MGFKLFPAGHWFGHRPLANRKRSGWPPSGSSSYASGQFTETGSSTSIFCTYVPSGIRAARLMTSRASRCLPAEHLRVKVALESCVSSRVQNWL